VVAPPASAYYVTPGYAALHGYGQHQQPGVDQLAYQHGSPPAGVQRPLVAPAGGGDRYAWKIAGFSECSQSCGGG